MRKLKFGIHEISTIEIWGAGTLCFCAGAASAGWALGEFGTAGTSADWLAALAGAAAAAGTWAIGVGANRYAQLSYQRQQLEADALAERERRMLAGKKHRLRVFATLCKRASAGMESATKSLSEKPVSVAGAYGVLDAIIVTLGEIDRSSAAWELLDDDGLNVQADIGMQIAAFHRNVERFKIVNPDQNARLNIETAGWNFPRDTAKALSSCGDALLGAVERLPKE